LLALLLTLLLALLLTLFLALGFVVCLAVVRPVAERANRLR
jgi:type III secretory pathway component EscU